MQLRAIIIDDEKKGINTLRILVEKFIQEVRIVAQSTKAADAIELIEDYKPEIVFLDINMPGMNGFELLEKLKWKNFSLIFVTAHHEYALKALKNNAVDYIMKPIDHQELRIAVNKVKAKMEAVNTVFPTHVYESLLNDINQHNKNKVLVNLRSGIETLNAAEIIFLESRSNYTYIHLSDLRVVITSKTLKDFEDPLCTDHNFMRVHKSFVINLNKISRYIKTQHIIMVSDHKIPLGKSRKENFHMWLNI